MAFAIFMIFMIGSIAMGITVVIPLLCGFVCFFIVGILRKHRAKDLMKMAYDGVKTSVVVIKLMVLIGCLTALWRAAGTISFFVYYGIKFITPTMFIFTAFLLTALLSYFLGSSFGVASTAGVMLMILARSGGINEALAAGAIMSGSYFGDRTSPVSSSAFLTATITGIGQKANTKILLKTGMFPLVISGIVFAILSFQNPIAKVDDTILTALKDTYNISLWAAAPAVVLLILPCLKCSVSNTILVSSIVAFVTAAVLQGSSISELGIYTLNGYTLKSDVLGDIMAGGGVISMVEVVLVVVLSSSYAGIFEGTGMLDILKGMIEKATKRVSLFTAQLCFAFVSIGIFCNQTIATILSVQLLGDTYEKKGASKTELASDIGNSLITICGIVPWSIACAVPLSMLDIGIEAIQYSIFLWLNPLCYIFTKKLFFKKEV